MEKEEDEVRLEDLFAFAFAFAFAFRCKVGGNPIFVE